MSYQIYVFHLRVYLRIGGVNECIWDDCVDVESDNYRDAELAAKKEFVRRHRPLHGFTDYDQIEVCNYERA